MFEEAGGEEMTEDAQNQDNRSSSGTGAERVLRRTSKTLPLLPKALGWGFSAAQVAGREDGAARKNLLLILCITLIQSIMGTKLLLMTREGWSVNTTIKV